MPKPHKNEKQTDFMKRCIPVLIKEGKPQDQAIAICYWFWSSKPKNKS